MTCASTWRAGRADRPPGDQPDARSLRLREQVVHGRCQGQRPRRLADLPRSTADRHPLPVEQNRRHIKVLEQVIKLGYVKLPRRIFAIKPTYKNIVLVSASGLITRPRKKLPDLDSVVKVDQFRTYLLDRDGRIGRCSSSLVRHARGIRSTAPGAPPTGEGRLGGEVRGRTATPRRPWRPAGPTTMARQIRRPVLELRDRAIEGHGGHLAAKRATDAVPRLRSRVDRQRLPSGLAPTACDATRSLASASTAAAPTSPHRPGSVAVVLADRDRVQPVAERLGRFDDEPALVGGAGEQ